MNEAGTVKTTIQNSIGTVTFFHPKKNSLPGALLKNITEAVVEMDQSPEVRVIVLRSDGEGPFCAGASFDELLAVDNMEVGKEFFSGFARLILAMKSSTKLVISRVHGKAVGGGVGLVAASDYAFATQKSSVRLSELDIGIGPFVVGPAIERKIGAGNFSMMSIDTEWKDAEWAEEKGLYSKVFENSEAMDDALEALAKKLAASNPEAMAALKSIFWEGTEDWSQLLENRAAMSGRLVLSDFTVQAISKFKQK